MVQQSRKEMLIRAARLIFEATGKPASIADLVAATDVSPRSIQRWKSHIKATPEWSEVEHMFNNEIGPQPGTKSAWRHGLERHGPLGVQAPLSKRELFAAMAMQGLLSESSDTGFVPGTTLPEIQRHYAQLSVGYADALLAELAKPQEGGAA